MRPEALAVAIVSATIAALALLLNWHKEQVPKRPRLAGAAGLVILAVATAAISLVMITSDEVDSSGKGESPPPPTAAEFREAATNVCARLRGQISRLEKVRPRGEPGVVALDLERAALEDFRLIGLPFAMTNDGRDAVALWSRRITLIEDVMDRRNTLSHKDVIAHLALVDRLTRQLNRRFGSLGLHECRI